MKKVIMFAFALTLAVGSLLSTPAFASRWDLTMNDGFREFHLMKVDTIGGTDVYKGRVDNGGGEDQDIFLYLNLAENELAGCLLGSEDYFATNLSGTPNAPLADTSAIGPFIETSVSGMIQTNLFLKIGPLPPLDSSNLELRSMKRSNNKAKR